MPKIDRRAVVTVAIAIVAFVLGGLLLSGEKTPGHEGHERSAETSTAPSVWTCSMHPQIQLPKEGRCPICFMDLIPLDNASGDELDPTQLRMSEVARQLAQIETAPVVRAKAAREVKLVGKVAYDETRVAHVTAWVAGRLEQLYADYTGITVDQGDPIARIYSPELIAGQEELIQAGDLVESLSGSTGGVLQSTAVATRDAARGKLRLLGLSDEQVAKVEAHGTVYEYVNVTAPVGGVVVHKDAQEGMYVQTGTRLYTLADLSRLWIEFEAYESDLPWLRIGQSIEYGSRSLPGERFNAAVTFIDPVLDQSSRTVKVRAEVENSDGRLKPDMFVSGSLTAMLDAGGEVDGSAIDTDNPLLVPASAVLVTGERAVVYVELPDDEGPMFEGREIQLGPRAGDFYIVSSGLSENESVVVNGAFKIDAELQIRAKPSMMSAPQIQSSPAVVSEDRPEYMRESDAVVASLTPVYELYFEVQMGLAKDDHAASVTASTELLNAIASVDMSRFSPNGHERWMNLMKRMIAGAEAVSKSPGIKEARDGFLILSNGAIDLHHSFGHAESADYYLTFCPMAFDNAGAFWLQRENVVWNSYWGAAMLRCGEIKESLEPGPVE